MTIAELTPETYMDTVARVASLKVTQKQDQLGTRFVSSGVLEDKTFKVPYICYKLSLPLAVNSAFRFKSVYVHEFEDRSLLLILTEYSRAEAVEISSLKDYFWLPRIGSIRRPVVDVRLSGVVSSVSNLSGLIKRCNNCRRVVVLDACPQGCDKGWSWDFRVSARLYDGTGSIKMILVRSVAARIVQKSVGEILFIANSAKSQPQDRGLRTQSFELALPETLDVWEAVVEDPWSHRRNDKLIVPDGTNLVYFVEGDGFAGSDIVQKRLDSADPNDCRIIRKLIEKAIDIRLREITGRPRLLNTYLLHNPIPLYSCEEAKLYLGFSLRVNVSQHAAKVEVTPQASVRESVWDYVKWRRQRGASASAIESGIMRRQDVQLTPSDRYGNIERLIFERAGDTRVSGGNPRTLVDFWRDVYGIEVSPEEMPLLKVRPADSEVHLTYPPSTIYFSGNALFISARTQDFIASKKASLEGQIESTMSKALKELTIGQATLDLQSSQMESSNFQGSLLRELRDKLYGRSVSARGSITQLNDRLYFFPNEITLL